MHITAQRIAAVMRFALVFYKMFHFGFYRPFLILGIKTPSVVLTEGVRVHELSTENIFGNCRRQAVQYIS
jgi:hypothetical protein